MKKIFIVVLMAAVAFCTSCNNKKATPAAATLSEEADANDSTVYGVCGDGTSMHSLQLITDMGDTI